MIKLERLKITINFKPKIKNKIKKEKLYKFYNEHLSAGFMHPAQWFKDAMKWYQIHTFNNPYNIGRPNAELTLLLNNKKQICKFVKNLPLVFWGVGKSDTEMEIVNYQLESNGNTTYVIAIDINYKFLKDFANALRDKVKENPQLRIYFLGINGLFEDIHPEELNCFGSKNKIHICLGNTIGNYEKIDDIILIFKRNMNPGDFLLVGFQSDRLIESTFKRYENNEYLEKLFTSSLEGKYREIVKKKEIVWRYNEKKRQIEAWIGNIQIFRSKKFNPNELKNILKDYGFAQRYQFEDEFTTCIHLYEYKGNY